MNRTDEAALQGRRRRLAALPRSAALAIALLAALVLAPVHAATTWSKSVFVSNAVVFQDPYSTACTAASAMTMLNTVAYRHAGGAGFVWTPYRVKNSSNPTDYRDLTSIQWFERARDTLAASGAGSDAHGWRNALNAYGWGSKAMTDPSKHVYEDLAYTSYDAAVHSAVRAIARFGMPVGILTWAGHHAQVMTGYVVQGADPATSDAFVVQYVFLTDPLFMQHLVNVKVSNATFRYGPWQVRFQPYRQTDSPYDDPYVPGWKRSSVLPAVGPSQWYQRWVIIAPIQAGLPTVIPPPSPSPSPIPTPTPSSSPDPTPPPSSTPDPSTPPSSAPSADPATSSPETITSSAAPSG